MIKTAFAALAAATAIAAPSASLAGPYVCLLYTSPSPRDRG